MIEQERDRTLERSGSRANHNTENKCSPVLIGVLIVFVFAGLVVMVVIGLRYRPSDENPLKNQTNGEQTKTNNHLFQVGTSVQKQNENDENGEEQFVKNIQNSPANIQQDGLTEDQQENKEKVALPKTGNQWEQSSQGQAYQGSFQSNQSI